MSRSGPQAPLATPHIVLAALACGILLCAAGRAQSPPAAPIRGLSEGAALRDAYDTILNADFAAVGPRMEEACVTVPTWCAVMESMSVWWHIALEPENRRLDERFARAVDEALAMADAWTEREPRRAEAWFARGAALGARAQWRVLRRQRLAAARDGKNIRSALEQALALDPQMHDAKFGIGMYRYYADVAPAALRMFRWLFLLPGGDREDGLAQMLEARAQGFVIRGEADYQLHLIYLWYEERPLDALAIIRDLQHRHPRNPLFALIEADIHDVYFHDEKASETVLLALIARAETARVNESALALRRARAALTALHAGAAR